MSTRKYMMYCHASQDAYFYDYQTHGVHLYQIVRKMRGIMTLLQQKAIMYLSSCYINSLPAVLQWQPQTGRKVAIIGFLVYLRDRLKQPGPHIIVTPAERIVQWRDEFLWFSPEFKTDGLRVMFCAGDTFDEIKVCMRAVERFHADGKGFVLLTPPEVFIMMRFLRRIAWDCFIIDEPFQMIHNESEVGARLRWLGRRVFFSGTEKEII